MCFFTCPWLPKSDAEPWAALKFDLAHCGIFPILLFFGLTIYKKCYINPADAGSSSKRKNIAWHAGSRDDKKVRSETNFVRALFCPNDPSHALVMWSLKNTQVKKMISGFKGIQWESPMFCREIGIKAENGLHGHLFPRSRYSSVQILLNIESIQQDEPSVRNSILLFSPSQTRWKFPDYELRSSFVPFYLLFLLLYSWVFDSGQL